MNAPKSFGAVELAKYCQVSRNTIHNWIRDDKLKAFKLPGGHYRVEKKELINFLEHYKMPLPDDLMKEEPKLKVLIVSESNEAFEVLSKTVKNISNDIQIDLASGSIEACIKVGTLQPDVAIIDFNLSGMNGVDVGKEIKKNPDITNTKIIIVAEGETVETVKASNLDCTIAKSLEAKAIEKEIKKLMI